MTDTQNDFIERFVEFIRAEWARTRTPFRVQASTMAKVCGCANLVDTPDEANLILREDGLTLVLLDHITEADEHENSGYIVVIPISYVLSFREVTDGQVST